MKRLTHVDDLNIEGHFLICFMSYSYYGYWFADRVALSEDGIYRSVPLFPFSRTVEDKETPSAKSLKDLVKKIPHACLYHCDNPNEIDVILDNIIMRRDPEKNHASVSFG